jgi:hypothetical protein
MAIDYKQLRAGNLVKNHKGEVHVITPWDIWNLECLATKNMIADKRLEDWRYIPLDEEWLLKLGFKKNGYGGFIIEYQPSIYNDIKIE